MGGVRNGNDSGSPEAVDTRQRSPAGLSSSGEGSDVPERVERHRQAATRLLKEGQAARAFGELVRASRTMPMTPRLASVLVAFSLRAGTEAAAIALLSSALGTTRGETRRAVRLQLARVLRRVGQLPRAIEALQALVDEAPGERRARRLIDALSRRVAQETPPGAGASHPWSAEEDTEPSLPEETHLEAQLIARRAWRELARFYLARADGAKEPAVRAEALTRLAELLENELEDFAGAARVYGQLVALTGDRAALAEQVRLVSRRGEADAWGVRRVLDEAVRRARTPRARATAFLARGEWLLSSGERARAHADFEAAVALTPGSVPALMGLARSTTGAECSRSAERLRAALVSAPRRTASRVEGLRCLAELASGPLDDARLAHWAWSEVLADSPEDVHAREQLLELARRLEDRAGVVRLLRARLAREPRGWAARQARLELVATLEAGGEHDAALSELRQAVRAEPGHKEVWLLLVDRLLALGQSGEAAWAMEHAATATEDETERLGTWERLARFCREVLGDAARARLYANRAENLRTAIAERVSPMPHPEPPRGAVPRQEPGGQRTVVLIPPPGGVELTPTPAPAVEPSSAPTVLEMPVIGDFPPAPAPVPVEERPAAFERIREHPLEVAAYRELSAFFSGRGDTARASLMAEVASALLGERGSAPPPPRHPLTPEERAGLRHPGLRNPAGELLASVGFALCRLFPTFGRAAGSSEPLRPDSGPGARAVLEMLRSVSRLLDVQLPEVFLSEEEGPPFSLVHPGAPRLLVGRLAVRRALPEPELRFFAGRALACLGPDLLALRCLRKDQLLRAVAILSSVLSGGTDFGPESRVLREALHPRAHERALRLLESARRDFDASALAEAARHSTNRVGLVACGGPGPAVAALRAHKASEQELVELVRFAASERYLPLRG